MPSSDTPSSDTPSSDTPSPDTPSSDIPSSDMASPDMPPTEQGAVGAVGFLETTGFTPAMAALDVMEKAAPLQLLQAELNDFLGVVLKITGSTDAVETALREGAVIAERMQGGPVFHTIRRVDAAAMSVIMSRREFNPLIQQDVVFTPLGDRTMSQDPSFALGMIETQGFTAVFAAIDRACKAANVEVVGKEKLGGGYITVVVKGDVAAVKAAIESGKEEVEGLGKLIASHVIPRPSAAVLSLLPQ